MNPNARCPGKMPSGYRPVATVNGHRRARALAFPCNRRACLRGSGFGRPDLGSTAAVALALVLGRGLYASCHRPPVPAQSPRSAAAIVICLAAGWSVVAALGLAGLTLAVHATALGGWLSHLIGACVLRLRATYATPGGRHRSRARSHARGCCAGPHDADCHHPPARHRTAAIAARANSPAGRPSRAIPGSRARGPPPAGRWPAGTRPWS